MAEPVTRPPQLGPDRPDAWPDDPRTFVAYCPECEQSWSCALPCDLGPAECEARARLHLIVEHDLSGMQVWSLYLR